MPEPQGVASYIKQEALPTQEAELFHCWQRESAPPISNCIGHPSIACQARQALPNSHLDSWPRIPDPVSMDIKKVKLIAAGVVIVLLGIVIFQNFEEKTIKILFAEIRMPVAILLILTFAIGMLAGWIAMLMTTKKVVPKEPKNPG